MKKAYVLVMISVICLLLLFGVSGCKDRSGTGAKKPTGTAAGSGSASGSSVVTPAATGEKTKIDLMIVDAYFSPIYPTPNEDTTLKFIVRNQGVEAASGFSYSIKLYKDGIFFKEDKFISDSAIGAGNKSKIINIYKFADKGVYYAEIYIDPENSINELVETNNYLKTKADATVMDAVINTPHDDEEDNSTE